jgi:hypothetical protein
MTLLDEALARFDKLIHSPSYQDLAWAHAVQRQMNTSDLAPGGRPVCPVLRPHLVTRRQYDTLAKVSETLYSALDRVHRLALENPALLARLELLPAEKMLAQAEPGYANLTAASTMEAQIWESSVWVTSHSGEGPTNALYTDLLAQILFESRPMKELRKKYRLVKQANGTKKLVQSVLTAYRNFAKKERKKFPRIGIVEFNQSVQSGPSGGSLLLASYLRQAGCPTEVVSPEQLEYRNGALCRGDFGIEIVYRRVSARDLLVRFDLNHPLLRAYRDGAVCMVNSFRAELVSRPSVLSLLTDDSVLAALPAAERKVVKEHVPWTRVIAPVKTTYGKKSIDLIEFALKNKDKLVLRPNDRAGDLQTYQGWETEGAAWERALKSALRAPYVVQERKDEARVVFPVMQFGRMEMREMIVDMQPHIFLGKVDGSTASLQDATSSFSLLNGVAPVFILEGAG